MEWWWRVRLKTNIINAIADIKKVPAKFHLRPDIIGVADIQWYWYCKTVYSNIRYIKSEGLYLFPKQKMEVMLKVKENSLEATE